MTAVIDARGRVLSHTELFRNGVLTASVATRGGMTPYVRFGDWFACGVTLIAVAIVLSHFSRRRLD